MWACETRRLRACGCAGLLLLALTACSSPGSDTVGAVTGSAPPAEAAPTGASTDAELDTAPPTTAPPVRNPAVEPAGPRRVLPNLVGLGLQVAQNRAQDAGFPALRSHDALARKRVQIFDRDWKVCSQSPAPGRRAVSTRVDFGVVKLDERCPKGQGGTPKTGRAMPDLRGKSVAAAVEALGTDASITWRDGTGRDRAVLLPTNWRVCAQLPKPGAAYGGAPVTLTVVKDGEDC
ncbi:MAG TPA: hypothetical protein VLL08_18110 [Kineosporiaceae bacterium]|nr:hypothetical protein [Kineosporiaceae bacterium]